MTKLSSAVICLCLIKFAIGAWGLAGYTLHGYFPPGQFVWLLAWVLFTFLLASRLDFLMRAVSIILFLADRGAARSLRRRKY